ncbi:DUF4097 family beta strand repeat-containing protein [Paenibacillus guangzhouensis]|uniref:DUF4097 family beta strand repeat-containing protein n=1 Tax=Paenibacillus guangzhouensis TaxID=1473112 RepID=UPI001266B0EF|nr:DUF4097 family beta strand repeat-containing protein [Paenibacillus guangzhouensis]
MIRKFTYFIATCCIVVGVIGILMVGIKDPNSQEVDFKKKWDFQAAELKKFVLDSDYDVNVEFIESTDATGYVELTGKLAKETVASLEDAKLVNSQLKLELPQDFKFQVFNFSFSSDQKLVIAMPKGERLDQLDLHSTSSNLDVELAKAKDVQIKTTSGNLEIKQLEAEQVKLGSTSGNITGEQLQGQVALSIKSGNVSLSQLSGDIVAVGISGDMEVKDHVGKANLRTASGNVELTQLQIVPELHLESISGNVDVTLPGAFDGYFDVETSTGDIDVPKTTVSTKDLVKARTTSGNISITKR